MGDTIIAPERSFEAAELLEGATLDTHAKGHIVASIKEVRQKFVDFVLEGNQSVSNAQQMLLFSQL
jgi:hypothetical protein